MSSLDNLKTRINYYGGKEQQDRMIADKRRSLDKALLYSYQAATAQLSDGRKFRCLINPSKVKENYDDKVLSIPFSDVCLNRAELDNTTVKKSKTIDGRETIDIAPGDVFTWVENDTNWLVYLRYYEELAYFRADIRRCDYEISINDATYKVYVKGPTEEGITWHTKNNTIFNDLNYTATMYVTKDDTTIDYFHRFSLIKLNGNVYEVQAIDDISTQGIITVALKETYTNSIAEEEAAAESTSETEETLVNNITGDIEVYPYDTITYKVSNKLESGVWSVNNSKVTIKSQTNEEVNVYISTGKSGSFVLTYTDGTTTDTLSVTIKSF